MMVLREFLFFFAIVLTTYDALQNTPPKISEVPRAVPFFGGGSLVMDWYKGELSKALPVIFSHEISFVMYYAPWDAESQHAKDEFDRAAQIMYKQVHFAAINCWQPGGECRSHHVHITVWPIIIVHTNLWKTLVYNGPKDYMSMVKFLNLVIKPLKYLTNQRSLLELEANCDGMAVGFIPSIMESSAAYNVFYNVALKRVEFDPFGDVCFGVITSEKLVSEFGVESVPHIKLSLWNETVDYPVDMPFREENITSWIFSNIRRRTQWFMPSWRKSSKLQSLFNQHPVLLLFTPRNQFNDRTPSYDLLREVALEYNNCLNDSHVKAVLSLMKNNRRNYVQNENHKRAVCKEYLNIVREENNAERTSIYNYNKVKTKNVWFNKTCKKDIFNREMNFFSVSKDSYLHMGSHIPDEQMLRFCHKDFGCSKDKLQYPSIYDNYLIIEETIKANNYLSNVERIKTSRLDLIEDSRSSINLLRRHLRQLCMNIKLAESAEKQALPTIDYKSKLSIEGLRCQTNDSLFFIAIDSILNSHFAESLGINILKRPDKTAVVILDSKKESQYLLEKPLGESSVREFLYNFTQNLLPRNLRAPVENANYTHYYGSDPQFKNVHSSNNNASSLLRNLKHWCRTTGDDTKYVCVKELNSSSFIQFVDQKNKALLVVFCSQGAGACGGLLTVSLLRLAHTLDEIKNKFEIARIDASINDLPWEYTVSKYPTLILFPADRKENSRSYPENKPISTEGIFAFVLSGLDTPTRLHAQVLLCNNTMDNYGMKKCLSTIRQSIVGLIGKHLKLWRRSREVSVKNTLLRRLQYLRAAAVNLSALSSTKIPSEHSIYLSFCETIRKLSNVWRTTSVPLTKKQKQVLDYDYL